MKDPQFRLTNEQYAEIRKRYIQNLKIRCSELNYNSIIVFQGSNMVPLYDTDRFFYNFEQESNFQYLTGVQVANMKLIIDLKDESSTLFYQSEPESSKIWMVVPSKEDVEKVYGIPTKSMEELNSFIQRRNMEIIYIMEGINSSSGRPVFTAELEFKGEHSYLEKRISHNKYIYMVLCDMRAVKLPFEIDIMRTAAKWSTEALCEVMKEMKPELNERDMENVYLLSLRTNHYLKFYGFNPICASGPNSATLHYDINNRTMKDGDLFLADVGTKFCGYTSDTSLTIPVNGKFTNKQKEIYDVVLMAKNEVIKSIKCGKTTKAEMNELSAKIIINGMKRLGILDSKASDEEMYKAGVARSFMPHSIGHFIGLDVHDVGEDISYKGGLFENGTCYTVEPGIYFIDYLMDKTLNDPKLVKYFNAEKFNSYRGFGGVRIEDTIVVYEDHVESLQVGLPRTTQEIEAYMAKTLKK